MTKTKVLPVHIQEQSVTIGIGKKAVNVAHIIVSHDPHLIPEEKVAYLVDKLAARLAVEVAKELNKVTYV